MGVSDVESVEGCGRNVACVEDLVAARLRIQPKFEGVRMVASGSKQSLL